MFKRFRQGTISILGVLASLSLAPIANAAEPLVTAVANAASYHAGSVSPGQMVVIFGVRLGPSSVTSFQLDSRGRIATSLAGTQVTFDGIPAPLLYVSQSQVAAVVPYAVSGRAITQIRVSTSEGTSQPLLRSIAKASPGIFTVDSSGRGQGAISNSTGTPNSPSAPALPGSFVSIFLTGEGLTDPLDVDGTIAAEAASARETVSVRIAGRPARVLYAGAAPGNVRGFAQLNVMIPPDLEFGGSLPLEVQVGDAVSQSDVTIAIAGELPAKPGIPQQVTAAAEASQIMIRWAAADARATRFRIERRPAPLGDFAEIGTAGATARSYADSSVTAGVAYIYRVRSENAQGLSEPSSPSLVTASASQLAAPTDLRATAMSPTQINLSWSASGPPATSFVMERRQESAVAFAFFATASPGSVRAFQDSTAQPDTKYRYRIRALDSAGGSPFSEEATATTPALVLTAPVLRATAISTSRIRLTWTATATGIVRFIVERRSGNGQYVEVSRPGSAVTTLDDDGLAVSTQYVYRMRLETTAALSPYSNEATATTLQGLPLAPTNLQATATSSTEVTLTWVNNAPDATAIRIDMLESGATNFTDLGPAASLTSVRIPNLRPSTAYGFVVRAQNAAGFSPYSNAAGVVTQAASVPPSTSAGVCMIFVHGSRESDSSKPSGFDGSGPGEWQAGRNTWRSYLSTWAAISGGQDTVLQNASDDFILAARGQSRRPYYVIRHNGAAEYGSGLPSDPSTRIAAEIIRATEGLADDDGNRCERTVASGGQFWVVAHSGGAQVLDFILGNAVVGTPNYRASFQTASSRISGVFSVGGAHRGTFLADIACKRPLLWSPLFWFVGSCTEARKWMQTDDVFQVSQYSSAPLKTVWLIGGSKGAPTSAALDGENDGVLSFASQFACSGSPTARFYNSNVCGNNSKMQSRNFRNLDTSYENHDDERNNVSLGTRERRAITDGIWQCSGRPCASNQSSAELIGSLLDNRVLTPSQAPSPTTPIVSSAESSDEKSMAQSTPSFRQAAEDHYRQMARYPDTSAPIESANDPVLQKAQVTPTKVVGPPEAPAELSLYPRDVFFESPNAIVLYARYSPGPNQISPSQLTGKVFKQDHTEIATAQFHDDGTNGDATAGDQLFTATINFPADRTGDYLGLHTVVVEAGAGPWAPLVATAYYHYGDPGARLTGTYSDQIVNGDLEINADVEIAGTGRYHLEASLYTEDGRPIAWAQNAMELPPGRHRIPLLFHGLIFSEKAANGPFLLKYVSLSNTTQFPGSKARIVQDAYVTQPFQPAAFTNQPFNHPEMIREANKLSASPRNPGLQ